MFDVDAPVDPGAGTFCVLPFIHLAATVDGVWGRCCFDATAHYSALYRSDSEPQFVLHPQSVGCLPGSRFASDNPGRTFGPGAAFNSEPLRRTRLEMLSGARPEPCQQCFKLEDMGLPSHRRRMNLKFKGLGLQEAKLATSHDGHVDKVPSFLDIRLGNLCNLRCVMCCYPVSSAWGTTDSPSWTPAHIDPYGQNDEFWNWLRDNAVALRHLYIAGGEPFLQRDHIRLLRLLTEQGAAQQISLHYNSNLTILPSREAMEYLSQFQEVEIAASCDGAGEVYEAIRTGARWSVFVENLRVLKEAFCVWLDVSPQRDNIADIRNVVRFALEECVEIRLLNFIHSPKELSLRSLPPIEKAFHTGALRQLSAELETEGHSRIGAQLGVIVHFMHAE